jgi:zinc protease
MLQLNYLYFIGIRRDEDAFNAFISRMKNMIKPMRANPQVIFQDTLSKIVSMNSPREVTIPTEAQFNQVNLDRLLAIYKDRFADASDFTYFMVGNFKVQEVIPLLEKYIGGLPSTGRKEIWKNVEPGFPKGLVAVDVPKNSEPQSLVAMVWKGDFKWKDKYRQGFAMLMNILSIKLRESMREEQSGVYGVSFNGSSVKYPEPEYTITSTWGCNPDSILKLTQTVLSEMAKIKKEGPTMEDLNKVKETLIRDRETKLKENNFWVSALQNLYLYGDRLLTLEEYKTYVNSFRSKDIKKIADKYLDTENYVKVALTPATKSEVK